MKAKAILRDACAFGVLTAFLVVGLIVIVAPESTLAQFVRRVVGVESATAAAPPRPATQTVPPLPVAWTEPQSTEADAPEIEPPPEVAPPAPPADPVAQGERGGGDEQDDIESRELERPAADAADRYDSIGREYHLEMQALGWHLILDPAELDQDTTLALSRAWVRQVGEVVSKYAAKSAALVRDLRAEIHGLAVSELLKKELATRFERYVIDTRSRELWELDQRGVATARDIIELLATSKRGVAWKVEGGQLLFARGSTTSKKHAAYMDELTRIAQKRAQIYREIAAVRKHRKKEAERLKGGG